MVEKKIPSLTWLRKQIEQVDSDLLREMVKAFAETLMSFEADSICGAEYGQKRSDRLNHRNGYRSRRWDTRVGSIDLPIPKLRQGSYFPDWLLNPRRRSERALVQVIVESYVKGVSTRRVEGLVQAMGVTDISKSQVSEMAKSLDQLVDDFRNRRLDQGPYPYLWLDAMAQRCREGGRVVNVVTVTAIAVNQEGRREILGMDVFTSEDQAAWTAFLRGLVERGLNNVQLVISDAHQGLKAAIASELSGAAWQRCRTHFARNLLTRVPKSAQDFVAALVRSIFAQPNAEEAWAQHKRVVEQLANRFTEAADRLEEAGPDVLAYTGFPKQHWRQIWSNNPQERFIREIRRRTDVVSIFPNRAAIIRLVGAVLAEQNDEWLCVRRYMSLDSIKKVLAINHKDENSESDTKQIAA